MCLQQQFGFAVPKGPSQCLVKHSVVGERAPSRLCEGYRVEAGGFLPATIAITHPTDTFCHVMRSQAPAEGLPSQGVLHFVFLRGPQAFHNCHCPLFSRSPEPYHSSLDGRLLQGSRDHVRVSSHRDRGGRARALNGNEKQCSRTLLGCFVFVCLSSFSVSGWVANRSPYCYRCLRSLHSCPPLPAPPPGPPSPPAPTSTSRVPISLS